MVNVARARRRGLDAIARIGLGEEFVRLYDAVFGIPYLDHLDDVDPRITEYRLSDADARGSVLIPMIPGAHVNNYRESILAHAFETRGYRAITPTCGGELSICPYKLVDSPAFARDLCFVNGRRTAEAFGRGLSLSELLPDSYTPPPPPVAGESGTIEYDGIRIEGYAEASTRKYFRRYRIDPGNEEANAVYRQYLRSAQMLADAYEPVFERGDLKAVLVYEDHYIHGGVPIALADEHGVPAYSIEMGFRDGTFTFGKSTNRNTLPWYSDHDLLESAVSEPLTDGQSAHLDQLIEQRETGDSAAMYNYSTRTDVSVERRTGTTVAMFTNLPWDASLETSTDDIPFPDVFEWIDATIDRFAGGEADLIVKTHPAELVHGTNESVYEHIAERHDPLPENVRVLAPDTDVNTYELIDDIDVGVVYNSTVGLEMAYRGIPVVVGGDTHYRGLGFTHDPRTEGEYFGLLDRIDTVTGGATVRDRARRYLYFLLTQKSIDVPVYTAGATAAAADIELLPVSHDRIKPGNENFDLIVERIVAGEPVATDRPTASESIET